MKQPLGYLVALFLFCLSSLASAAPRVDVTVFDAREQVVHRGKTKADGTFSTATLPPGKYVVQFNSNTIPPGTDYAIVVSSGTRKVVADSVTGEQFSGGGVAMRVKVGPRLNINGQVAAGGLAAIDGGRKTKVVNGRRYVWVEAETGSNIQGRWEEEGIGPRRNVVYIATEDVRNLQERGYDNFRR